MCIPVAADLQSPQQKQKKRRYAVLPDGGLWQIRTVDLFRVKEAL